MSDSMPAASRPFGQIAAITLLFLNAGFSILFWVAILLLTGLNRNFTVPVAIVFGYTPALSLASLASPLLMLRRSALGLILAWCVALALLLDFIFCMPAVPYFPPAILKMLLSLSVGIGLLVCLIIRSTYAQLNPKSYGFPVLARMTGVRESGTQAALVALATAPSTAAAVQHKNPDPSNQSRSDQSTTDLASLSQSIPYIPEGTAMNPFRSSMLMLRIAAWSLRIPALLVVLINLGTTFWFLGRRVFSGASPYGPSFGRTGMWEDSWLQISREFWSMINPAMLACILILGTFLLTGLAELMNVILFTKQEHLS